MRISDWSSDVCSSDLYSAATDNGTFASTVTVPSGAKYTRFSYGVPGGAATTPADYINSAIASTSLSELVSEGYLPNQTFEPLTLDFTGLGETSGYIKTDGAQTTTSGWVSTDFFELPVGMEITCHLFGHTVVRSVAFYDASKT